MVSINYATREVTCKIVYYGPGLSGKTTNLIYVHKKVPATTRGKMISLATEADRTLYFDFLPINIGTINGFTAKFQLYTVPGQVYYNATRKLVLRGVDGLVFVADSQAEKMDENIESLTNLKENLEEYGYNLNEMPIVIQYNKRDLPGVLSVPELEAKLNNQGWRCFEAEAVSGKGVFDTLKMIIKMVLEKAKTSKSSAAMPKESAAGTEPPRVEATVAHGSDMGQAAAAMPPMTPPPVSEPPIRQEAYAAPAEETAEETVEEESQNGDSNGVEYNTINDDRINIQSNGQDLNAAAASAENDMEEETDIPVSADGVARPFPGSTTSRILRRERRITVSDFQPAGRDEDVPGLRDRLTAGENKYDSINNPNMPTPSMAPSQRLIKKKSGFFKRLFGIK